jgi:hypothetical protein
MTTNTLSVARFICRIQFQDQGGISKRWGQTFRGGLGYVLRELFCTQALSDCKPCLQKEGCAYSYLFESPVPSQTEVMRLYTYAPHPFIIEEPEVIPDLVELGGKIDFSFVLIGKAIEYFPFVARAIEELGSRGVGRDSVKFWLLDIVDEVGSVCWTKAGQFTPPDVLTFDLSPGQSRTQAFILKLMTPLRLQVNGQISRNPNLYDLVSSLCRRLLLLRYFHGDGCREDLASRFLEVAKEAILADKQISWYDHLRHSSRKKVDIPIGGLVGWLRFEGDIGILEPLLRLGEYIHLGKNVIFGLGRVSVSLLP